MSVEFSDYRPYGVGDDLRYVDWNIYGRLDRLYLKLFVDEEDLCLHLLLDGSASMGFGEPSKLDYAARLAARARLRRASSTSSASGSAWCASGWRRAGARRAGGATSCRSWSSSAGSARRHSPRSTTGSRQYALRSREAGLAVLVSDLMDPAGYERGLKALLERRFDVHVVHVLAPEEMNPSFGGDLRLRRCRDGRGARPHPGRRRRCAATGSGSRDFLERAEQFCRANEISYHRVVTDTPVEEFVLRQLKGLLLA